MKRNVLLHYHIFKNAGSTVDSALEREFGARFAGHDLADETALLSATYLRDWLISNPEVQALSTHQGRFPLPEAPELEVIPLILFRHPIDRAGSVYTYERRIPGDAPGPRVARSSSMPDYVRWRFTYEATPILTEFQVRFLSGARHDRKQVAESHFNLAMQRMESCSIVGTVEHLEESLAYAETILEPAFGFVDLSYRVQNASGRETSMDHRLKSLRTTLGTDLFMELLERNAMDMQLHQAATNLLMTRIRRIPGFSGLLSDFQRRCQARRAA